MFKTKINPNIIIYYLINIIIIAFLSLKLPANQFGLLIIIAILTIFLFINKYSIIILSDKYLIIEDNYFFIKTKKEKLLISVIEKIDLAWVDMESGIRGNVIISMVIGFVLGLFWSQPTCDLFIYIKDKEEPYKISVNAPKSSMNKLFKYIQANYPQIEQKYI